MVPMQWPVGGKKTTDDLLKLSILKLKHDTHGEGVTIAASSFGFLVKLSLHKGHLKNHLRLKQGARIFFRQTFSCS